MALVNKNEKKSAKNDPDTYILTSYEGCTFGSGL